MVSHNRETLLDKKEKLLSIVGNYSYDLTKIIINLENKNKRLKYADIYELEIH